MGEWAALLLDALVRSGVRDAVISPGSRSTPFVVAAVRHPELRCHHVVDERAAAFHALGRAKVADAPVLLICTSGSAPAHYLPAIIEASESGTPLVVLSADRPLSLQGCGAPQTVDQVKLFGDHVRLFVDVGTPDPRPAALRALRRSAVRAVSSSRHPRPGPVHINARVDKPLEPGPARTGAEREAEEVARRVAAEPLPRVHLPRAMPGDDAVGMLVSALSEAEAGLLVCGPAGPAQARDAARILELARRAGLTLLAEAGSQLRFAGAAREGVIALDSFDAVLRSPRALDGLRPDLVLQVGASPVSAGYEAWLAARGGTRRVVLSPHRYEDPSGRAADVVLGEIGATVDAVLARLPARSASPFAERLRAAERVARRVVREQLAAAARDGVLAEGAVARGVVEALPRGGLLALGNSLPIRSVDAWAEGELAEALVFCQRGAAGIDGLVAGAAGAAAASARPTALLVGDVSFLHDLSGLATARGLQGPFAVVVVQNGGGRIFEQLPVAALDLDLDPWITPTGLPVEGTARLFDHAYARAETVADLGASLREALARPGCTVVEAVVPPHDAAERARLLWSGVDVALSEVWP